MIVGTIINTFLFGKFIGCDDLGNRYFQSKKLQANGRHKRWVLYKGTAEASKIPAAWHGWLHYTTDQLPTENKRTPYNDFKK